MSGKVLGKDRTSPWSDEPEERGDLKRQVDAERGLISHRRMAARLGRPELDDEADSDLDGEGRADMEEVERTVGASGCRPREELGENRVAQDRRHTDPGDRDPWQPGWNRPAQDQCELRHQGKP